MKKVKKRTKHVKNISVHLVYKLTGRGWSRCELTIEKQHIVLTASYLGDALSELIHAVTSVMTGEKKSFAIYEEEPGQYFWTFECTFQDNGVILRILWSDESWGRAPDEDCREVFAAHCSVVVFARALLQMLDEVLEEYGEEGYKREWEGHDFPTQQHAYLKRILSYYTD